MALPLPNEKIHVRVLERFARWFASAAGVWQTTALTAAVIVVENFFPHLDNHGFWLLYYLTAYSAVTQPILAYVNKQDTTHGEDLLEEILDDVEEISHAHPSEEK
jgi:predicted NAD/FAD-binding protein